MTRRFVLADIGRAGLGNELFPVMRALSRAESEQLDLLPPKWFQLRIGPTLRGERDRRAYWRLFRRRPTREYLTRVLVQSRTTCRILPRSSKWSLQIEKGMGNFFEDFDHEPSWYRDRLLEMSRASLIMPSTRTPYVSLHIRMGDFAPSPEDAESLASNNHRTPLSWFIYHLETTIPHLPVNKILVSSDGSDEELSDLLRLPGVQRSNSDNAIGDLICMSDSVGMLGSRSTFTAWAAYLGQVPLLTMRGGNAYRPHEGCWEAGTELPSGWTEAVMERLAERKPPGAG